jgi:putative ABC transport system substrate-binding protein
VTGFSNQSADLALKRIELLREMIPGLRRLAVLVNPASVEAMVEAVEVQAAASRFNVVVARLEIRHPAAIPSILESIKGRADALYVAVDGLLAANRIRINAFALTARIPAVWNQRVHVERGALMSYGPDFAHLFRRTAEYVDKILRGAKPADLPIEQPTKFDFVVNLSTARSLGLTISESILLRADEVIE